MTAPALARVELLLDLLNTTPVVAGTPTDELSVDTAARQWFQARGVDAADLEPARARRLRHVLQDVVRGVRSPDDLNASLIGVTSSPRLIDGQLRWDLATTSVPLLEVDLILTWAELTESMPDRLRPCGNDECNLFFLDRTRAGTGRWCSMTTCGNRMKARRHYERTGSARRG